MNRAIILLLALAAGSLFAQQDMGVITGVITDESGAAVPAAKVTAVNRSTNETWPGETSETGAYTLGPMRIGSYNVQVEKAGFKKAIWEAIELHAQDRARVDFQLQLGQLAESVLVTAEAPLLQSWLSAARPPAQFAAPTRATKAQRVCGAETSNTAGPFCPCPSATLDFADRCRRKVRQS